MYMCFFLFCFFLNFLLLSFFKLSIAKFFEILAPVTFLLGLNFVVVWL